ncbi:RCS-specific HTH-type transcriptional activator RclR [Thalassocella blandensis]|nr:RCS-specific HTH-type transcriptional activator RclR [Thalassocella blandensis]
MSDPLTDIVSLLQPQTPYSKLITGAGAWRVIREEHGNPVYWVLLEGSCRLTIKGQESVLLSKGDFALIPESFGFSVSSVEPDPDIHLQTVPVEHIRGEFRLGDQTGEPSIKMLVGHCEFGSADAAVLVSLLPQLIHIHGDGRLAAIVQLVRDESLQQRPAREAVLAKLLEVLLIEALRYTTSNSTPTGLLRGLADERLSIALRLMHASTQHAWTVAELAKEAALSRSAFFERFSRTLGLTPMEYLLNWRMALAKNLLRTRDFKLAEISERVGYGSASAFSVAFSRHVGLSPSQYLANYHEVE